MDWSFREEPTGNPLTDLHRTDFPKVADLYDGQNPGLTETYRTRADVVAPAFSREHRNALADALHAYMTNLGATDASLQSVERLRDPNTVVVVTGQQAGLFTGPLYSLYKAMSAIGLAKRLESRLNRPVVPVFWVASEDHDWGEVDHAYLLDDEDSVQRLKLEFTPDPHRMVYHTNLPETAVHEVVRRAADALPEGPGKADVLQVLLQAYEPGMSMARWFARIMLRMMEPHGLVVLDPCLPELRSLVKPVWQTAIREHGAVHKALDSAYGDVERRGLRPEVVRDESNTTLFYVEDGKRYVLERVNDNTLRARGLGITRSVEEWLRVAEESPTSFSSNVLLRPVVQDTLLPVVAYVGGPSELAYHPLSRGVFHAHGRTLPPLAHRDRVLLYTPSVVRNMAKWGIEVPSTTKPQDITTAVMRTLGGMDIESTFQTMIAAVEERWQAYAAEYRHLGAQVEGMARAQIHRELAGLQRMQGKTLRLLSERNDVVVRQLRHIERWLWTDGSPQERRLCPLNVWTRFGLGWLKDLPIWGDFEKPGGVYHVMV